MNLNKLDIIVRKELLSNNSNLLGLLYSDNSIRRDQVEFFNKLKNVFFDKQPKQNTEFYIENFKNDLLKAMKEYKIKYFKTYSFNYLGIFTELFFNIGENESKIENSLNTIMNRYYNFHVNYMIINGILDLFYNSFKNDVEETKNLNDFVVILNKNKIKNIKILINSAIKNTENWKEKHNRLSLVDFKNILANELFKNLYYFYLSPYTFITKEEEKEINLSNLFAYLNNTQKIQFFKHYVLNLPEKEKEFLINSYFQKEAIKKLFKNI